VTTALPAEHPEPRVFFTLVDQLRGVGALLVVYSHLVANFLQERNRTWIPGQIVDVFLLDPLNAELNFGWIGVALFFFVSGFVVTSAASRENARTYAVRRLLRIYPPVFVLALLVAVISYSGTLVPGLESVPTLPQVLLGASLANYLILGSPVLIAVGWTLVIEMFFYIGLFATRPLLHRAPALVTLVMLVASLAMAALSTQLGTPFALAASFAAFVPLLLLGQITFFARMSLIPHWQSGVLLLAAWAAFVFGMHRTSSLFASPENSFMANAALAFFVFVAAVLLEGRLKPARLLAVVARRSYSLYLLHVPVGFTLLMVFVDQLDMPYTVALVLALLATAGATEIMYRFIERPSIQLGRHLTTARSARELPTTSEMVGVAGTEPNRLP
jgi:exopolysaccharide production protein ExoZ